MPILNFQVSQAVTNITQIACMFNPLPPFQYTQNGQGIYTVLTGGSNMTRDTTVASAGFPFSADTFGGINVTPLPANSYVVNSQQNVFGNGISTQNVVQINTVLASVEPGFSRVRIDYTDPNGDSHTEYFDCPFYEGWDVTANELNEIVEYIEGAFLLLQNEINDLRSEMAYLSNHEFWKGTSVSGQINWTGATEGLATGALSESEFPHDMMSPKGGNGSFPAGWPPTDRNGIEIPILNFYNAVGNSSSSTYTNHSSTVTSVTQNAKTPTDNVIWGYYDGTNSGETKGSLLIVENTDHTISVLWKDMVITQSGSLSVLAGFKFNCTGGYADPGLLDGGLLWYTDNGNGHIEIGGTAGNGADSPYNGNQNAYDWDVIEVADQNGNLQPCFRAVLHPSGPNLSFTLSNFEGAYNSSGQPTTNVGGDVYWYPGDSPTSIGWTYNGQPQTPSISGITSIVCASTGSVVTVTGNNFETSSSGYALTVNGVTISNVIVWNDTSIEFTVPSSPNIVPGSYLTFTIDATAEGAGPAQSIQFFYQATPDVTSLVDTTNNLPTNQFFEGDTININGSGFGATTGTVTFTTSSNSQVSMTVSSWSDTLIVGTAPSLPAGPYTLTVNSSNCGASQPGYQVTSQGEPGTLIIVPTTVTLQQSQVQQFEAFFIVTGENATNVTNSCTWACSLGTINGQGFYTAPASITSNETDTVTANYETFTATATVNLISSGYSSPVLNLTVKSQINVFLGDGRAGYIPVGTTYSCYPGDYIYVKFDEIIDPLTKIPDPTYNPIQLLQFYSVTAFDPTTTPDEIYNLIPRGYYVTSAGVTMIQTWRTVVLGVCDPSDGNWHSMWDIGLPQIAFSGQDALSHSISVEPKMAYYGEDLPAFSPGHEFTGSIVDYIDDLAGAHQKQLTGLNKRSNLLVAGNCFFDDSTGVFSVIDQLQVLAVDDSGRYKVVCTVPAQEFPIKSGEFLWIKKDDTSLHVNKLGDAFNANDIVLGVRQDRFYTKWPILPQYMVKLTEGSP